VSDFASGKDNGSPAFVGALGLMALWVAVPLFSLPFWVPLSATIVAAGAYAQKMRPGVVVIVGAGEAALSMAVLLFSWPFWMPTAAVVLALALIVKRFWGF
jgi:hypothetical protein